MTTQINLKLPDELFEMSQNFSQQRGYVSVQEFIRDAMREMIFDSLKIRPEYEEFLLNDPEANTFLSEEESEKFTQEMKRKTARILHEKARLQQTLQKKNKTTQRTVTHKRRK